MSSVLPNTILCGNGTIGNQLGTKDLKKKKIEEKKKNGTAEFPGLCPLASQMNTLPTAPMRTYFVVAAFSKFY